MVSNCVFPLENLHRRSNVQCVTQAYVVQKVASCTYNFSFIYKIHRHINNDLVIRWLFSSWSLTLI